MRVSGGGRGRVGYTDPHKGMPDGLTLNFDVVTDSLGLLLGCQDDDHLAGTRTVFAVRLWVAASEMVSNATWILSCVASLILRTTSGSLYYMLTGS